MPFWDPACDYCIFWVISTIKLSRASVFLLLDFPLLTVKAVPWHVQLLSSSLERRRLPWNTECCSITDLALTASTQKFSCKQSGPGDSANCRAQCIWIFPLHALSQVFWTHYFFPVSFFFIFFFNHCLLPGCPSVEHDWQSQQMGNKCSHEDVCGDVEELRSCWRAVVEEGTGRPRAERETCECMRTS